ncbi:hypothetical protein dsx2_2650 [Desulfovibrio sp. X2]|uniref:hypothetical protein n=1 Tax=Desulfovibrio sp. X2 TaxID=941449 RepID=UPI000358A841|nr:hypothetical protein [Desulfovibrio sp. X2]EPR42733.1 hypothetical protein dsx2_2650 [Desulfovibrio sp. X2]
MTIATTLSREQYAGNGLTTAWPVPFTFYDAADIIVVVSDSDGSNPLTLELGTDYSVSGGDGQNGAVLYPVSGPPLASGKLLTLYRDLVLVQDLDLVNLDGFDADLVERQFDRSRMIDQQLQEQIDRCVKAPVTDPEALTFEDITSERAAAQAAATAAQSAQAGAETAQGLSEAARDASQASASDAATSAASAADSATTAAEMVSTAGKEPYVVTLEAGQTVVGGIPWTWTSGRLVVQVGGVDQWPALGDYTEDIPGRAITLSEAPGAGIVVAICTLEIPTLAEGGSEVISVTWDQVSGKPSSYPPSAHGHAISDVAGLQGDLDAIAASAAAAQASADAAQAAAEASVGVANLGYTASPTQGVVTSDTGTDATLSLADGTNAGLMAPAEHTKLAGVAAGATANSADSYLLDRANHTGSQAISTVTGLQTALDGKEGTLNANQKRTITVGTAAPSGGSDGDIYLQYT